MWNRRGIVRVVRKVNLRGDFPMRDWLLIAAPFAVAFYFLLFPDQWWAFVYWFQGLLH